jgi:hypothetical protein
MINVNAQYIERSAIMNPVVIVVALVIVVVIVGYILLKKSKD